MRAHKTSGFTLLEVLIAIALTAVVGTIAYSGLSSVLMSAEQTQAAMARSTELSRAMRIISRDFEYSVNRPIRDELGFDEPAMMGGDGFRGLVGLTRSGWPNGGLAPRGHLERVYYYLDDTTLYRMRSTALDRAYRLDPTAPLVAGDGAVALLTGVEAFEVVFLYEGQLATLPDRPSDGVLDTSRWRRDWGVAETPYQGLPVAVEIHLRLSDLGDLVRVYVPSV